MTAFRKVWRDLWNNKGRTLLVVLSIAVGVLALGLTTSSNTFVNQQMDAARRANQSPHARMVFMLPISDDAVEAVVNMPEVADAEGWITANARWKPTLDGEWQEATLMALTDYAHQKFDLMFLISGAWPGQDEVMIEEGHREFYKTPAMGDTLYFEVNDNAVPVQMSGALRDPAQAPPPFNPINKAAFYVNRDTMARLTGLRDFNHLRFSIPSYSKDAAKQAVTAVEEKLKRFGATRAVESISSAEFQDPEKAQQQEFLNGLNTILVIMAILSMGLSVTLVINTINAIITQQVTQIGIMKTIGGEYMQIVTLYLVSVLVYGGLSLLIAVPLGMTIGFGLSRFWLTVINVNPPAFQFLPDVVFYQVVVGIFTPLLAALWPILRGISIPVREAIASYGLGKGQYGSGRIDRWMGRIQNLPRMVTLALRNTFRRAGRVALTQLTLVSAGAIFIMVTLTGTAFTRSFNEIWEAWGFDVVLVFDGFQRNGETEAAIWANPDVDAVEMWVWMQAKAHRPGETDAGQDVEVQVRGIPRDTKMYHPKLAAGRVLDPQDGHALILNYRVAEDMGLNIGDQIVINLGAGQETTWTIVGTASDIGAGGRQNTAFMWREVLTADLHQAGRATVAQIGTREDTFETQERVKKELTDHFKTLGTEITFSVGQIENRRLGSILWDIIGSLLQLMTFLVALVGSIGLSGTLSINVMERRREIGVMRAVGASSVDVALIFMGEGLLLGVLSWALAVPFGILGGQFFVEVLGDALQFPFSYSFSPEGIWTWLGIIVVLSLAASWFPARRATQISVRESLAYE